MAWEGRKKKKFISTLSLLPDVSVMFGKPDVIHNKITVSQDLKKENFFFLKFLTLLICLAHSFTNKLTLSLSSSLSSFLTLFWCMQKENRKGSEGYIMAGFHLLKW